MVELVFDVIYEILEKLSPIELIKLRTLNKNYKYYIDMMLKRKMEKFKKHLGCPLKLFDMLNGNAIISGSCLVQYLLNECYENFDIDIFIDSKNAEKISNFLMKENYKCEGSGLPYIRRNNGVISRSNRYSGFRVLNFTRTGDVKIQLIVCKYPKKKILSDFDFNIVKNYYDGRKIIIKDIYNLSKKVETCNESEVRSFKRVIKYFKRGFKFVNSLNIYLLYIDKHPLQIFN